MTRKSKYWESIEKSLKWLIKRVDMPIPRTSSFVDEKRKKN
jgi:hypothetical protein